MKFIHQMLVAVSLVLPVSLSVHGQSAYPEKYKESVTLFVEGYNKQDYATVKKSFTFLAKSLVSERAIMGEALTPRFQEVGRITRLGTPKFPAPDKIMFPLVYEKDSTIAEYLVLTFSNGDKINSFAFTTDNIIYTPLTTTSTVDSVVKPYLDDSNNAHTGLIIGTFVDGKKQVFSYGETATGNGQKPTDSTLYQIGSITKTFTGLLLANSLNNGSLDSLKGLSALLPGILPALRYADTEINPIHLATHTSALPREPANLKETLLDKRNPFANYGESPLLSYLKTEKLTYKPGERYAYSNTGMGLLGYMLTQKRNATYEQLLTQAITSKLGMTDTRTELTPTQARRKITSYANTRPTPDFTFQSPLIGAGGIYSTVADMLRYLEANIAPEQTPLAKDMLLAQQPRKIDKFTTMGLGWEIQTIGLGSEELKVFKHSGNTMGTSTFVVFSKEKKIGVVVLANSNTPVEKLGLRVFALMNRSLPKPLAEGTK
jgi:CubicO group peptidase (beta-lactamase class C family)